MNTDALDSTAKSGGFLVATRVDGVLRAKILDRQRNVKRLTGITPSVSAVVRAMIAEAPSAPMSVSSKRARVPR